MLANTRNQKLESHSFAVGELSVVIFENMIKEINLEPIIENENNFKEIIRFSGYLHDTGKIDSFFQNLLKNGKKSEKIKFETSDGTHVQNNKLTLENYIRHNELSFILINALIDKNKISTLFGNKFALDYVTYIAYWHHAKILRKDNESINSESLFNRCLRENTVNDLENNFRELLKNINNLYNSYYGKNIDYINYLQKFDLVNTSLPNFKSAYLKIDNPKENREELFENEARRSLLRSIVVTADRIISNLSKEELEKYITKEDGYQFSDLLIKEIKNEELHSNLHDSISVMLTNFEQEAQAENNILNMNRNKRQTEIVQKLITHKKPVILSGPAGCGKTKIFLEWIKEHESLHKDNKKVFIIAPRNMICKGLYDELTQKYLKNESIEIYTGEHQLKFNKIESPILENEQFSSKIIITTIDQIIGIIISHKKIDMLLTLLDSYLIFDEYHEFFNIPGIVVLFKELLLLKQLVKNSKTLLVSATPNYYFADFLNCKVENMESFNDVNYEFSFNEIEDINSMTDSGINNFELLPELENQTTGAIVIYNTATTSQISSLYNYKLRNEKNINYHAKFNTNDKNKLSQEILKKWRKEFNSDKVLRAGPIIQASLNISTHLMLTEISSAENWCQRLGRLNRFANPNITGKLITYYESILLNEEIKKIGSVRALSHLNQLNQTINWCKFIKNKQIATIKQVYALYEDFHKEKSTQQAYQEDFEKTLSESKELFEKFKSFEPYQVQKNEKDKTSKKLAKRSVRGRSLYVLPAKLDLKTENKEWLYMPTNESIDNINNAMSLGMKDIDYDYDSLLKKANDQAYIYSNKSTGNKNAIIVYEANVIKKLNANIVLQKAREINFPLIISDLNSKDGKFYMNYENLLIGLLDIKKLEYIDKEIFYTEIINTPNISL